MIVLKTHLKRERRSTSAPRTEDEISPEIYRRLYASLDLSPDEHPVIGVTSAISGEGRTTVALGLARTLAQDLSSLVTLVEVDLHRPALAQQFEIPASPGLLEVLRGDRRLAEVRCLVAPNLSIVTTGAFRADAASLLRQLPTRDPFRSHPGRDVIVLDLPPLLNHGYSRLAARAADALLLVVRARVTPIGVVREAIAQLEDHPPRGVVLNGTRSSLPGWWPTHGS